MPFSKYSRKTIIYVITSATNYHSKPLYFLAEVITSNCRLYLDVIAGPPTSFEHWISEIKWPKSRCRYLTDDLLSFLPSLVSTHQSYRNMNHPKIGLIFNLQNLFISEPVSFIPFIYIGYFISNFYDKYFSYMFCNVSYIIMSFMLYKWSCRYFKILRICQICELKPWS